jgi:structural maintenance of chromosome 1
VEERQKLETIIRDEKVTRRNLEQLREKRAQLTKRKDVLTEDKRVQSEKREDVRLE